MTPNLPNLSAISSTVASKGRWETKTAVFLDCAGLCAVELSLFPFFPRFLGGPALVVMSPVDCSVFRFLFSRAATGAAGVYMMGQ